MNMFTTSSEYRINNQTILKEHIDEHYQPTEDEIREYALYIGIDLDKVRRRYTEHRNERCLSLGTGTSLVSKRRSDETVTQRLESMSK